MNEERISNELERNAEKTAAGAPSCLVVVDYGKRQSRKKIRQLRKGKGKLREGIDELVAELIESKRIDSLAQPIVIIVREKQKRGYWPFRG
jgi:hypothetical protein